MYSWSGRCMRQKCFLLLPGIESRLLDCRVHNLLNVQSGDLKFMQEGSRFCGPAQMCRHVACLQAHNLNFISRNSCMNNSFEYAC